MVFFEIYTKFRHRAMPMMIFRLLVSIRLSSEAVAAEGITRRIILQNDILRVISQKICFFSKSTQNLAMQPYLWLFFVTFSFPSEYPRKRWRKRFHAESFCKIEDWGSNIEKYHFSRCRQNLGMESCLWWFFTVIFFSSEISSKCRMILQDSGEIS